MNQLHLLNEYQKNTVFTSTPGQLVVLLYDGLIHSLEDGMKASAAKDFKSKQDHFIKAENIILELIRSLDMEKGGEISKTLLSLYEFFYQQLVLGNMQEDLGPIEKCLDMIKSLREAWAKIEEDLRRNPLDEGGANVAV